jgi:3-oxoacyl-[acyl-carrier protein] reductase
MTSLEGKVAIVSGAGRGIGRATAVKLAREGARVVVNDRDADPAAETLELITESGGEAVTAIGDVTEADFGTRFVDTAMAQFGGLDIVVNNAGVVWNDFLFRMTDAQWSTVLDIHLSAAFRVLRAAQPVISGLVRAEREAGLPHQRAVVNVSSINGTSGNPSQANYASAKAGLIGLTRSLAKEWGRYEVRVNAVAFGIIATRMVATVAPGSAGAADGGISAVAARVLEQAEQRSTFQRAGTPEEAAGAIWLLCAPEAGYITGELLLCAGGLTSIE